MSPADCTVSGWARSERGATSCHRCRNGSSTRSCSAPAPAGEVCAGRLADGGLRVAIVEPGLIGGECSYYACMPSKALLRPGELLRRGARGSRACKQAVTGELDAAAMLARRDEVIHDLDDSVQLPWLEERGDRALPRSRAARRRAPPRRRRRGADCDAGRSWSRPVAAPRCRRSRVSGTINGRGTTATATTFEDGAREPDRPGGGAGRHRVWPQAWSYAWRRGDPGRGRTSGRLPREEPFAGDLVADSLRDAYGVDVRTGTQGEVGRRQAATESRSSFEDGSSAEAAEVLVAIGRTPRTFVDRARLGRRRDR